MENINKGVAVGAVWLLSLRFLSRGLGVVSTLILVRLLSPEDFGLNAIAMSIFAFLDLFSRFGFDTVLIQMQDADKQHYDTAWTFNVLFGFIASILIISTSSIVSGFYGNEKLAHILVVVSFLFILNGLVNIGVVDFRKNMTFDKEFKLQIFPKLVSFFCTLALALWLRNYWALIIGSVIWKAMVTIFSFNIHPYRPKFTLCKWRDLYSFSKWLFLNNFIFYFNRQTPELLIGKIISPKAAGFISIANELSSLATVELISSVNRAAYPGYSKVSHDTKKLKLLYTDVVSSISLWVFPAGFGLASVSELLVPVFFGAKWTDMGNIVGYLAIASMLFALNSNTGYVFLATDRPHLTTYISLIRVIIFIPLLLFMTYSGGLVGAAQAALISSFLTYVIYVLVIRKYLNFTIRELFNINIRPFLASTGMFAFLYCLQHKKFLIFEFSNITVLVLLVSLGALFYCLSLFLLWALCGSPDSIEKSTILSIKNKITLFRRS